MIMDEGNLWLILLRYKHAPSSEISFSPLSTDQWIIDRSKLALIILSGHPNLLFSNDIRKKNKEEGGLKSPYKRQQIYKPMSFHKKLIIQKTDL